MSATPSVEERKRLTSDPDAPDDLDDRARKRMKVGLSPRRPTAKVAPARPPDVQTLPVPAWVLALLLVGVFIVTTGVLALNLTGTRPAWWPVLAAPKPALTTLPTQGGDTVSYTLRLGEDFGQPTTVLTQGTQAGAWRTELAPTESVYRMEVQPNHLAWSLLGMSDLGGYRLQTSALVNGQTAGGLAGIIVRYQDERRFYLLSVDGEGRYAVQQQDGDASRMIVPWTAAPFLNTAGSANVLTVEDNGRVIRFLGNGMLLHDLGDPVYPLGFIGLAGGAQGDTAAQLEFDWFQLYDIQTSPP